MDWRAVLESHCKSFNFFSWRELERARCLSFCATSSRPFYFGWNKEKNVPHLDMTVSESLTSLGWWLSIDSRREWERSLSENRRLKEELILKLHFFSFSLSCCNLVSGRDILQFFNGKNCQVLRCVTFACLDSRSWVLTVESYATPPLDQLWAGFASIPCLLDDLPFSRHGSSTAFHVTRRPRTKLIHYTVSHCKRKRK